MNTELLERGPVQLELSQLLRGATAGQGKLVFLGGEAGVGKSSLVVRFTHLVRDHVRVLFGACDPLSTPHPLGPLLDMSGRVSPRFADLLEHHRTPSAGKVAGEPPVEAPSPAGDRPSVHSADRALCSHGPMSRIASAFGSYSR